MSSPTCYFCGTPLMWQSDFDYSDIFGEGEGIVSFWDCPKCKAEHQFSLKTDDEESNENDEKR